jgi:hypothetical protein
MFIPKIYRGSLALILILMFTFAGFIHAQDSIVLEDLPILASNASISDSFDDEINTHLYAFHASEGDIVNIEMVQATDDLDPFLVLLDASGAVLAADDDSGSTFLSAAIVNFEIPADGAYLVLATSLNFIEGTDSPVEEVEYTLALSGNTLPDGFNADEVELETTTLNYGLVIDSESTEDIPAALFVFEGTAGDIVTVLVESDEFPTIIHLFDPTGARLAVDPSAITSLELTEDGVYLILATDVFFYDVLEDNGFYSGGVFVLSLDGS